MKRENAPRGGASQVAGRQAAPTAKCNTSGRHESDAAALQVARTLAAAGVPIFTAKPAMAGGGGWQPDGGHGGCGYWIPKAWQHTTADPAVIGAWQPGYALCAVMGHRFDALDVDPRNGGAKTRAAMLAAGLWPRVFAEQATPSGGSHELIAPLGVASMDGLRPGLDVKAGDDGTGHGFIFLAPTVKLNKTTGEIGTYAWVAAPDLVAVSDGDSSGEALADMIRARRNGERHDGDGRDGDARDGDDGPRDWMTAETIPRGSRYPWLRSFAGWMRHVGIRPAEAETLMRRRWAACDQPPDYPMPWADAAALLADIYKRYQPGAEVPPVTEIHQEPAGPAEDLEVSGLIDWEEFWSRDHTAEDWLCEPILPRGRSTVTFAAAGDGKSLLALYVSVRVALGQAVLDQPAADPVDVLYFDLEQAEADLHERLVDMGIGPDDDLSHFHYYLLPDLPPADTAAGGETIRRLAENHNAALVVADTTSRLISGGENDSDTFHAMYRHTGKPLRAAGRTVWMLDHSGKDRTLGPRGSSAKSSDADLVWSQTKQDNDRLKLVTGTGGLKKRVGGWVPNEVHLRIGSDPLRIDVAEGSWLAGTKAVADLLDELGVPTDVGRPKVREVLKEAECGVRDVVLGAAIRYRRARPISTVWKLGTGAGTGPDDESGTGPGTGGQESLNQASEQVREQVGTGAPGVREQVGVPIRAHPVPRLDPNSEEEAVLAELLAEKQQREHRLDLGGDDA